MLSGIYVYPQPSPGWTFSVIRAPKFSQRMQRANSGRQLNVLDQLYPEWEWTLTYDILRDKNDVRLAVQPWNYDELRSLMGFFGRMGGSFTPFLFFDPTDGKVTGQEIGRGTGSKVTFQLFRDFGIGSNAVVEPIHAAIANCSPNDICVAAGLSSAPDFKVYVDAVEKFTPGDWVPVAHNGWDNAICGITFASAPANGTHIRVDMTYLWPCRFVSDSQDFENFLASRWGAKQLKIKSFLVDTV